MSRVFSAMTGTSATRPIVVEVPRGHEIAATIEADETFVVEADDSPFVEIGGPSGTVFSAPAKAPEAKVRTEPVPARSYPRIAAPAPAVQPAAPAEAPTYLSVRFHDVVPRAPGRIATGPDAGLVALHFPDHPVSGEYRTLRDEIAKQLPEATSRVLTFTSASPESGTTTVLLNLGVTLALAGQRVLVADANYTRAGVATKLALRSSPGLAEVLAGQLPLAWALQPTAVPSLQTLAAGSAPDAGAEPALGAAIGRDLPKLVGQLRQWFDWVLIDSGVWGVVPERDATCAVADAVYLVTRESDADRPEFTGLRTWVKQLGGALRGYVTTRV